MTLDPLDKKYQKSPDFPPDKADNWPYPPEQDGWMLAHNSIRKEVEQMIEALEACNKSGNVQQWQAACVKRFWKSHHSNEDDVMTPYLETRVNYPEKLTSDHTDLVNKLDRVDALVESLGQKEGDNLAELIKEMKEYKEIMFPHLKEEEELGLPLSRAYFTKEEIGAQTQKILSRAPKVELGSFIVCQGVDEFRNGFMKRNQIPTIAWYAQFKGCVAAFDQEFTKPLEAVKTGTEPVEASCCTIQ
ncbi:unnamed protein product [Cylindrotheca closterium]|uniref:Hemerythrin-like domain-containing protein n=1 Tax=Cylindrotheca closterium TaxID=2856 RepID=A0AAD2FYL4_9STRA|nr:unnamed protein product [Cylindrotheca closterium]